MSNNFYPEELIEDIKNVNDIVDVVSEYVKLKKHGRDYFGLCPFHKEKTPSFSVAPSKQIYYCFGCSSGGNVIHFIMNIEKLDYVEAIKLLAERGKIKLPEHQVGNWKSNSAEKNRILEVNKKAAMFFMNNLFSGENSEAIEYIKKRKISSSTSKKFGIGYATDTWDSLIKHMNTLGYDNEILEKAGLIIKGTKGFYDRFRKRIIFPIIDTRGKVLGFGGRVLDDSLPKYMNSPETPVFNKKKNLYGLNIAKENVANKLVIVEGYMDVVSLYQNGINNVVASLGTALTENQARLLKRYSKEIIISFDTDRAGKAATMRGLDILKKAGCNVKVLQVPDGKDPDEYIKNYGQIKFQNLIDNAMTLIEYKIEEYRKITDINDSQEKINFLERIAEVLAETESEVEIEVYAKKTADRYGVSYQAILSRANSLLDKGNSKSMVNIKDYDREVKKDGNYVKKENKLRTSEILLLIILVIDNSLYKEIINHIKPEEFMNEDIRGLAEIVFNKLKNNLTIVPSELIEIAGIDMASEVTELYNKIAGEKLEIAAMEQLDIINYLKTEKRMHEITIILSRNNEEGDEAILKEELKVLILKMQKLKKKKRG